MNHEGQGEGSRKEKARSGSRNEKALANSRRSVHRRDFNPGSTKSTDFAENWLDKQSPPISKNGCFWGAKAAKGFGPYYVFNQGRIDSPRSWSGG